VEEVTTQPALEERAACAGVEAATAGSALAGAEVVGGEALLLAAGSAASCGAAAGSLADADGKGDGERLLRMGLVVLAAARECVSGCLGSRGESSRCS